MTAEGGLRGVGEPISLRSGEIDDVDGPPRPQRKGAILSRHNSDKEPRHGF